MRDDLEQYIQAHTEEEVIIPLHTKQVINKTLIQLEQAAQVKRIFGLRKKVAIAMVLGVLTLSNVLLATDLPKQIINSITSFFEKTSFAKYMGDSKQLGALEQQVGLKIQQGEIELQVDSVALDDNFLNIFYTLKSQQEIPKQDEKGDVAWLYAPSLELKINGESWEYMGNGQDRDAYLEDAHTLRGMERINVAHLQLPDSFDLEIQFIEPCGNKDEWIINVPVERLETATKTIVVDQTYSIKTESYYSNYEGKVTFDLNIDKVIFSPLASQVIITEKNAQEGTPFEGFVFFDQDGNSLEMLTQWTGITEETKENETTNGFEFIPTENLEKIVIVPITRFNLEDEVKAGVTYDEQYRVYEKTYPVRLEIPVEELPKTIKRGPLIEYEILEVQLEEDTMLLRFKIEGAPVDQLLKTEIYPLDENKEWMMHSAIKSLSVDRQTGIYTLRVTGAKNNKTNEKVDLTKTKYLTLDDGGYLLPEQLLWNQAIEIDVSKIS